MTWGEWFPNAILCAVAIVFAAHAPERRIALSCAALIVADWLLYVMAWTPYSMHAGLALIGVPISSPDIWPIMDAFTAALILAPGHSNKYGWALWGLLTAQVVCHIVYWFQWLQFGPYSHYLDVLFWAQIACFILWGKDGVRHRIIDIAARLQLRGRPPAQAREGAPR